MSCLNFISLYFSGQGFAFKRREKIKHEYNKLLRKERKKMQSPKVQLQEEYPRHLYLSEREKLDEEEHEKKKKCKSRAEMKRHRWMMN